MKKALLLPAIALTMAGTVLFATQSPMVSGQTFAQEASNPEQTLIEKIAEKFHLNKDEVKAVFTEHKEEHRVQMQEKFEERLSQLVKDEKITEEQKAKILTKFSEIHANREAEMEKLKSKTPEQRHEVMKAHHDELQQWAKENGIDLESLGLFVFKTDKGMAIGRGMMGDHHIMEK